MIVHDLTRLGPAVDATVNAGANRGERDQLRPERSDRRGERRAREAVKALQAKADLYAKATGYRVGRLVSLSEGGGYAPAAARADDGYGAEAHRRWTRPSRPAS